MLLCEKDCLWRDVLVGKYGLSNMDVLVGGELGKSDEVQALKVELERARVVEEKFKSIAIKV